MNYGDPEPLILFPFGASLQNHNHMSRDIRFSGYAVRFFNRLKGSVLVFVKSSSVNY
jgi:hypothetical protein